VTVNLIYFSYSPRDAMQYTIQYQSIWQ